MQLAAPTADDVSRARASVDELRTRQKHVLRRAEHLRLEVAELESESSRIDALIKALESIPKPPGGIAR